jgi:hypothetical protein
MNGAEFHLMQALVLSTGWRFSWGRRADRAPGDGRPCHFMIVSAGTRRCRSGRAAGPPRREGILPIGRYPTEIGVSVGRGRTALSWQRGERLTVGSAGDRPGLVC